MIIKFGADKNEFDGWASDKNIFVSKPYFKIVGDNGVGIYILNSYKFNYFPKFYFKLHPTYWEAGVNFAGWILEFMWNKSFSINEKEENRTV